MPNKLKFRFPNAVTKVHPPFRRISSPLLWYLYSCTRPVAHSASPPTQRKHEMQSIASNQAVVLRCSVVGPIVALACPSHSSGVLEVCVHLLATMDEALLHGRDALLLLDLLLDLRDLPHVLSFRCAGRSMEKKNEVPCSPSRYRARSPCRSTFAPWGPVSNGRGARGSFAVLDQHGGGCLRSGPDVLERRYKMPFGLWGVVDEGKAWSALGGRLKVEVGDGGVVGLELVGVGGAQHGGTV